jgi:hypothetical protein
LSAVKTKIDFVIEGELAEKLEAYVERGLFASRRWLGMSLGTCLSTLRRWIFRELGKK